MKDLRFIFGGEPDPKKGRESAKLKQFIEAFNEQGNEFNKKFADARLSEERYLELKLNKDNSWSTFKDIFLLLSKSRCPICEKLIDKYDDIEHYRPKEHYWWLAYDFKNYYICCALCNRNYKRNKFPLLDPEAQVSFGNRNEMQHENPLLFNPTTDQPELLFEVEFHENTLQGGIIRIKPLASLSKDSYAYKKAFTTIEVYDLNGENSDRQSDISSRQSNAKVLYALLFRLANEKRKYDKNPNESTRHILLNEILFVDNLGIGLMWLVLNGNFSFV